MSRRVRCVGCSDVSVLNYFTEPLLAVVVAMLLG
jgi:hypothetical protein